MLWQEKWLLMYKSLRSFVLCRVISSLQKLGLATAVQMEIGDRAKLHLLLQFSDMPKECRLPPPESWNGQTNEKAGMHPRRYQPGEGQTDMNADVAPRDVVYWWTQQYWVKTWTWWSYRSVPTWTIVWSYSRGRGQFCKGMKKRQGRGSQPAKIPKGTACILILALLRDQLWPSKSKGTEFPSQPASLATDFTTLSDHNPILTLLLCSNAVSGRWQSLIFPLLHARTKAGHYDPTAANTSSCQQFFFA